MIGLILDAEIFECVTRSIPGGIDSIFCMYAVENDPEILGTFNSEQEFVSEQGCVLGI